MKRVYKLTIIFVSVSVAVGTLWQVADGTRTNSEVVYSEVGNSEQIEIGSKALRVPSGQVEDRKEEVDSEIGYSKQLTVNRKQEDSEAVNSEQLTVNSKQIKTSVTVTRDVDTPAGRVKTIVPEIVNDEINLIDLTSENFEYLAIRWKGDNFDYRLAGYELQAISYWLEIEKDDLMGEESPISVSELLTVNDEKYLYIQPAKDTKDIEIDLISTKVEVSQTAIVASAPSNYSSGPKYSSLNIIPRKQWSGNANINDPRVPGICTDYDDGAPYPPYPRPDWCDSDMSSSPLIWEPFYFDVEKIVVHHTYPNQNNYSDPAEQVRGIYNYHAFSNNWGDIGYNYLIDWKGNIYEGKLGGDGAKGYHASNGNYNSIGIAIIGSYTDTTPSQAAQDALVRLIAEKAAFYGFTPKFNVDKDNVYNIQDSTVVGHRNFQATECPGNAFYPILPNIASRASSYKNTHFSTIKNVVSTVNDGIDNGEYESNTLLLEFGHTATIDDLTNLFPAYGDEIVNFNGVESYQFNGSYAKVKLDYSLYGTQDTKERLRTLYKIFWLRSDVKAAGLNFRYELSGGF